MGHFWCCVLVAVASVSLCFAVLCCCGCYRSGGGGDGGDLILSCGAIDEDTVLSMSLGQHTDNYVAIHQPTATSDRQMISDVKGLAVFCNPGGG